MFSRLEPILRPVVRRTESTDTRLAIRRDESQDLGQRKSSGGDEDLAPIPWEDMATVSTTSLRAFLQTLLHGATVDAPPPEAGLRAEPTTLGSRATNAYQTMGRAVQDRNVVTESTPGLPPVNTDSPHPETAVIGHEFGDDELKLVQQYIADLIELERRGIQELTIQRSLTFLDSIRQAIATATAELAAGI